MDAVSRCTHVSDRYRLYFKPNDEPCLVAVSQADIDLCGRYLWIPLCRHWLVATHNNYGDASDHKVDDSCSVGFSVCAPWASCQIRKTAGAHAPGMLGTFTPPPRVSDPDMHHGTCVTHVPWCMPGSLTRGFLWSRRWGKTFPAFPAHAQPAILRIW